MSACTIRRDTFHGWDACILEHADARLVAVPDIGGRIMAFDLGPYPFLYVNPQLAGRLFTPEEHHGDGTLGAWKNYGGTRRGPRRKAGTMTGSGTGRRTPCWTRAGIRWTGWRWTAGARDRHDQPPDPRTGLQITRQFTLFPVAAACALT